MWPSFFLNKFACFKRQLASPKTVNAEPVTFLMLLVASNLFSSEGAPQTAEINVRKGAAERLRAGTAGGAGAPDPARGWQWWMAPGMPGSSAGSPPHRARSAPAPLPHRRLMRRHFPRLSVCYSHSFQLVNLIYCLQFTPNKLGANYDLASLSLWCQDPPQEAQLLSSSYVQSQAQVQGSNTAFKFNCSYAKSSGVKNYICKADELCCK